jgi:NMT1/THI5 like.
MYYNEYNSLINYGMNPNELNIFRFRDYGMNLPEDGIYCMEETYKKDPVMCRNFLRASIEGWNYALTHRNESLQVLKKYQKQEKVIDNRAHASWMMNAMEGAVKPKGKNVKTGELLKSDYDKAVQFLMNNKYITKAPEYRIFYRGWSNE